MPQIYDMGPPALRIWLYIYNNRPNLKVGITNSTQEILSMVVTRNVKCLPTRWLTVGLVKFILIVTSISEVQSSQFNNHNTAVRLMHAESFRERLSLQWVRALTRSQPLVTNTVINLMPITGQWGPSRRTNILYTKRNAFVRSPTFLMCVGTRFVVIIEE